MAGAGALAQAGVVFAPLGEEGLRGAVAAGQQDADRAGKAREAPGHASAQAGGWRGAAQRGQQAVGQTGKRDLAEQELCDRDGVGEALAVVGAQGLWWDGGGGGRGAIGAGGLRGGSKVQGLDRISASQPAPPESMRALAASQLPQATSRETPGQAARKAAMAAAMSGALPVNSALSPSLSPTPRRSKRSTG